MNWTFEPAYLYLLNAGISDAFYLAWFSVVADCKAQGLLCGSNSLSELHLYKWATCFLFLTAIIAPSQEFWNIVKAWEPVSHWRNFAVFSASRLYTVLPRLLLNVEYVLFLDASWYMGRILALTMKDFARRIIPPLHHFFGKSNCSPRRPLPSFFSNSR